MRRHTTPILAPTLSLAAFALLGACKSSVPAPGAAPGVAVGSITVTSKSFPSNGAIPVDYTCDGKDVAPQITWSAPPETTKSLVLEMEDPDAPSGSSTHWIIYDIRPDATSLPEGGDPSVVGAKVGVNDFESVRYGGPCPPKMQLHRYRFHLYALDSPLNLADGADRAKVDTAMNGHVVGEGSLYGTFSH
jgi:Raf kinase inhibitor-like YbhB/YbcL family protein